MASLVSIAFKSIRTSSRANAGVFASFSEKRGILTSGRDSLPVLVAGIMISKSSPTMPHFNCQGCFWRYTWADEKTNYCFICSINPRERLVRTNDTSNVGMRPAYPVATGHWNPGSGVQGRYRCTPATEWTHVSTIDADSPDAGLLMI